MPAAVDQKRPLVEPDLTQLSIFRQCELLGLNRSTNDLPPATESEENLRLMWLIDRQFLATPFHGSRRMAECLKRSGEAVNRKRVQRLMTLMDKGRIWNKTAWGLSLLLGQVSALLGVTLTLGYLFAFALLLPNKAAHWSSGPRGSLSIEPPLIGLCRRLGLLIARCGRVRVARFSVAGLILNALPLALALFLLAIRTSS